MISETIHPAPTDEAGVNGGPLAENASPGVETTMAMLSAQVSQLCKERIALAQTVTYLQEELDSARRSLERLTCDRDEQKQLVAALWDKLFPLDQAIKDFENYPPLDQCRDLAALKPELMEITRSIAEQRKP